MARKTPVRLNRGPLSGAVFALTNYREIRPNVFESRTDGKHDVTEDFELLVAPMLAEAVRKGRAVQDISAEQIAVGMLSRVSLKESA